MSLLCHKCGAELTPGRSNFYVVRVEAVADPTPPQLSAAELESIDFEAEFGRLMESMRDMSEQELMDQVCRRVTIHLCRACYRVWIEDPAR